MQREKMGRNPFEKIKNREIPDEPPTLFTEIVKPLSGIEKIKEMKVQVDFKELYNSVFSDIKKIFFVFSLFVFLGCSSPQNNGDTAEMRKQVLEIQKTQGRQSALIDELNNKILLLTDRVESHEKPVAQPVKPTAQSPNLNTPKESLTGDLKIYEMAMKDLKNQAFDQFEKKVGLLSKGYKDSPLTSNALFLEGEFLFNRKQFGRAARIFEKLYSVSPDGNRAVSALYYLGVSYEKLGRIQEAKEAFQSIINIYPGSREAAQSAKKLAQDGLHRSR